jgi:hypothetical protein
VLDIITYYRTSGRTGKPPHRNLMERGIFGMPVRVGKRVSQAEDDCFRMR